MRCPLPSRRVAALFLVAATLTGCRAGTVEIALGSGDGGYAYRYEVDATVTRTVDGVAEDPRRTSSVLQVNQRILEVEADGRVRAEVALIRDGGAVQRAVVRLDRAGSVAAIEQLDGVPADELGLGGLDALVLAEALAPPGELRPGQVWVVDQTVATGTDPAGMATITGSGRLDRLDAAGGRRTAVATTDLSATVGTEVQAGVSSALLRAVQRSRGTTAYDLDDGAVRWARVRTTGTARVTIDPPAGVTGPPVVADLTYEVSVVTRRR